MTETVVRSAPRGLIAGRVAKAMMISGRGGTHTEASVFAAGQNWRNTPEVESVLKAPVSIVDGSALVATATSRDFIELVRPLTLIDRISGFRPAPL